MMMNLFYNENKIKEFSFNTVNTENMSVLVNERRVTAK